MIFPDPYSDPDPANRYGSDRIRLHNTEHMDWSREIILCSYLWADHIDVVVERDVEVMAVQHDAALVPVRLDQQVQAANLGSTQWSYTVHV
jgi:hypothetical protein